MAQSSCEGLTSCGPTVLANHSDTLSLRRTCAKPGKGPLANRVSNENTRFTRCKLISSDEMSQSVRENFSIMVT